MTQVADTFASPSEMHTYTYDSAYRVSSDTQATRGTISYTYTSDDRALTATITGGPAVTYAYYPDGSLNTLTWSPLSGQFKYTYSLAGQYAQVSFPNGQSRSYGYDDQGRLLQLANTLGATNLGTFSYGYDVNNIDGTNTMLGQRSNLTANVPAQGFSNALTKYYYDPLYQLNRVDYPAAAPFSNEVDSWAYDAIGNRLSSIVNGVAQNYIYLKNGANPLNGQRLQSDGVNSYTWNFNGTLATKAGSGGNFTFGYDAIGFRLASLSGSATASYGYDYKGRRSQKTVVQATAYLYDGQNLIGETTNSVPTYYLYGPGIDEPLAVYVTSGTTSGFHYFDVDGLGSVVATNNPSGTIEHNAVFDAWGTTRSETGTRFHPFSYTGREVGEAGLLYYRARYLQPGVGRFTQEDPLRGATRRHYTYAANSPMAFTDPNGLAEHCTLSSHMLSCLQQIFTADAADIANVEVISTPKSGGKWFATTRPNLIIAYVPCNEFFAQHESVLEEYYHVLRQWKTGEMTLLGWLWETAKHGYEGNKFEIEAKAFASAALPIFDKCLSCSGVDR